MLITYCSRSGRTLIASISARAHALVLQLRERVRLGVGDVAVEEVAVAVGAGHVLEVDELGAAHLAEQLLVFGEA